MRALRPRKQLEASELGAWTAMLLVTLQVIPQMDGELSSTFRREREWEETLTLLMVYLKTAIQNKL